MPPRTARLTPPDPASLSYGNQRSPLDRVGRGAGLVPGPTIALAKNVAATRSLGTGCLRFIDPIGDTTFNRGQATVLLGKLAGMHPKLDGPTRAFIDKIIELAERVESGVHLYLKFEGD
jgi:hypothetical protein